MIQSIEVRDEHTVALNIGAYNNILPWAWSHIYIASQAAYEADPAAYATRPGGKRLPIRWKTSTPPPAT